MIKKISFNIAAGQRGVSLYLAILIMSILLAIVLGLDAILIGQIKTTREIGYSVTAFYAAETGIETALSDSSCTSTCGSIVPFEGTLDLGGGDTASYSVRGEGPSANCLGMEYCLKSTGIFKQTKRAIQISR
jgi:hypothetical protein